MLPSHVLSSCEIAGHNVLVVEVKGSGCRQLAGTVPGAQSLVVLGSVNFTKRSLCDVPFEYVPDVVGSFAPQAVTLPSMFVVLGLPRCREDRETLAQAVLGFIKAGFKDVICQSHHKTGGKFFEQIAGRLTRMLDFPNALTNPPGGFQTSSTSQSLLEATGPGGDVSSDELSEDGTGQVQNVDVFSDGLADYNHSILVGDALGYDFVRDEASDYGGYVGMCRSSSHAVENCRLFRHAQLRESLLVANNALRSANATLELQIREDYRELTHQRLTRERLEIEQLHLEWGRFDLQHFHSHGDFAAGVAHPMHAY